VTSQRSIAREGDQKDDFCLRGNFYIAFLYENEGVALDESGFSEAIYLELKADNAEEMRQKITTSVSRYLRCRIRTSTFRPREDSPAARRN
jgi:hypothetical protein